MNKLLIIIALIHFLANSALSQSLGFCGSGSLDNLEIRSRMINNRENIILDNYRNGQIKYVPVNYFLTAKNDGSGRAKYINVLNNLCAINEIYKDQEIQFYLRSLVDINNSFIFDDPSSTFGSSAIINLQNKNKNALNIFVASKANASEPGVLAFYNPTGDYIVSDLNYVTAAGTTLAHEIGHFFSLAHTFFGWEGDTYTCDITTPTYHYIGSTKVLVEYVDRAKPGNSKLHCNESADGFCDTPADYNLGFGFNGCNWNKCAVDPDEAKLDPDEANIMSYFLSCLKYFSTEQKAAIAKDHASTGRNYLRYAYTPLPEITDAPKNLAATVNGFNSVLFKWDAVTNATSYVFEIGQITLNNPTTYKTFITNRIDTTLTNLTKGVKYVWRVTPFNSTSFCPKTSTTVSFLNSNFGVATSDINNTFSSASVGYIGNHEININIEANEGSSVSFELFSLDGKLLHTETIQVVPGNNNYIRAIQNSGAYTYKLYNKSNSVSGKFFAY